MNKLITTALVAVIASAGSAALQVSGKQHVPERLGDTRPIRTAAANKNHILLCNVGNAIPKDVWGTVVTYAVSRLQVNTWTNSTDKIDIAAYALDVKKGQKDFGEKAKVCVFFVDDPKAAGIIGAPRCWCAVNVCDLKSDKPDAQTLRDRYAKTILRGMAYACGSGATLEPVCSLFFGAMTNEGMDETGIMISPTAYFPMLEGLKSVGGIEMLSPASDE